MANLGPLSKLREELAHDINAKGVRPLTTAGLLQLLDKTLPADKPKAAPAWPKVLYSKFSGHEKKFFEQASFNSALASDRWVEHPAQVQRFPVQLWRKEDPAPRLAWNKFEEERAKEAGFAQDANRKAPLQAFRPAEKPQTWPAFLEQCDDPALRAQAELYWNQAGRNELVAGHLSDWLSKVYFLDETEN